MLIQKYRPTLRDIVKVDSLPENLGFLQDTLWNILDKLYYQKLQLFKSSSGHSASYNLDIVTFTEIKLLEIPGTGVAFVLNPPDAQGMQGSSVFNVSFDFSWEILKYKRNFNLQNFSFGIRSFIELITDIYGITVSEMLGETIVVFIGDYNDPQPGEDPLQDFVNAYNANHTDQLSYTSGTTTFDDIFAELQSFGQDIFELIITDYLNNAFEKLKLVIAKWIGPLNEERLKDLIIPNFGASINNISFGIEFPRSILIPLGDDDEPLDDPAKSILRVTAGAFSYNTKEGFLFDKNLSFTLQKSQILNTGFTIDFQGLKIDFSRTRNIPEADLDGRPPDFIGVYVKDATIGFPTFWNHDEGASTGVIKGRNLLIGTGGISGTIGLEGKLIPDPDNPGEFIPDPNPLIKANFGGGFSVSLNAFSLAFQQNAIVGSDIKGKLTIPGFTLDDGVTPAEINVDVHIGTGGEFKVTASSDEAGLKIKLGDVFNITLKEVSVGRTPDERFFINLSGNLGFDPSSKLGEYLKDPIEIQKLTIYDDGKIEFAGGVSIQLAKPVKLPIGPAEIFVTAIHLGAHEQMLGSELRKYLYFGFDGGVNVDPGGVNARGDGIKYYFTFDGPYTDDIHEFDDFIRISSIKIDLIIPGNVPPDKAALLVSGYLSMKETPTGTEYIGGVDFSLPKAHVAGTAAMRLNPKVPAFLIDVGLELPAPIPLGPTGLGIYGFRGLFGKHYLARESAAGVPTGEWYQYYKAKIAPDYKEGIQVSKFALEEGFSVGVGVSLATATDTGRSFSSKIFLLVGLPGTNIFIQGQAQFVKERIGLDTTTDPPFSMLLSITDDYVFAGFGLRYLIKEDGKTFDLNASLEMKYFFKDSSAWFVHFGTESNPMPARIIDLFDAYAFLEITKPQIRGGAGVSFDKKYEFVDGILKADLHLAIDIRGRINFRPRQLGGSLNMAGYIKLRALGIGTTVSAYLNVAAEISNPYYITGELKGCITVRALKKKEYCADIKLSWIHDSNPNLEEIPLLSDDAEGAKARNMVTQETFKLLPSLPTDGNIPDEYIIPVDSYIDIKFKKPVNGSSVSKIGIPGSGFGNNWQDQVPKDAGKLSPVSHHFIVAAVNIKYYDQVSGWLDYDIYDALTPLEQNIGVTVPSTTVNGYWQVEDGSSITRLTIMAESQLQWTRTGNLLPPPLLDDFNITSENLFCLKELIEEHCIFATGTVGSTIPIGELKADSGIIFHFLDKEGKVSNIINPFSLSQCWEISPGAKLEIIFPVPVAFVKLKLLCSTDVVKVSYIKNEILTDLDIDGAPIVQETLIEQRTLAIETLIQPVIYPVPGTLGTPDPVSKIIIEAGECKEECEPSQQLFELEVLLNLLAQNSQLTVPFADAIILNDPPYDVVYNNSSLPSFLSIAPPYYYWAFVGTTTTMSGNIGLAEVETCLFSLSYLKTGDSNFFPFSDIKQFSNMLPLGEDFPNQFIITAMNAAGDKMILTGRLTCYPAIECPPEPEIFFQQTLCQGVGELINTLQNQIPSFQKRISGLEDWCDKYANDPEFQHLVLVNCNQLKIVQAQIAELQAQVDALTQFTEDNCTDPPADIPCAAFFYELCWLTVTEVQYNESSPDFQDLVLSNTAMIEGLNKSLPPIWRPDTKYVVQVLTNDRINGNDNLRYHNFAFKTEGPVGHFHQLNGTVVNAAYTKLKQDNKEDEFKLAKLSYYIDFEKSFPDAAGNLLDTKPLFYDCPKLLLFFTHRQAYLMYSSFAQYKNNPAVNISLKMVIKDPLKPDDVINTTATWKTNPYAQVTQDVEVLNNLINDSDEEVNCIKNTEITTIGMNLEIEACNLQPLKIYTAIYNAHYKGDAVQNINEVHRHVFFTSRYANFKEQVESYLLKNEEGIVEKNAFFDLEKSFSAADVALAASIVNNTLSETDSIRTQFSHIYDRLIDGAFKLEALAPAETTEFTVIWNSVTNKVLGILIRNPEPFNIPKLPVEFQAESIKILTSGVDKVIFSKDGAKAFVTNGNLNITDTILSVRFQYFTFNSNPDPSITNPPAYIVATLAKDEVTVDLNLVMPTTTLITADCGKTGVDIKDILTAIAVIGAEAYEFSIKETGSADSPFLYTRDDADGKFPLYEFPDLKYNRTYDIQVRPLFPGRRTVFGSTCQITMKNMTIVILDPANSIQNYPVQVRLELRDNSNKLVTDYPASVTLQVDSPSLSATGGGLVQLIKGVGTVEINDAVAETVTLTLSDTENTGLALGTYQDVIFAPNVAVKIIIDAPLTSVQGTAVTVTLNALNAFDDIATAFNGSVTLVVTENASVPNSGLVNFVNGIGTIAVSDDEIETTILSLENPSDTSIDVSDTHDLSFSPAPAISIIILDPADGEQFTPVSVTVQAINSFGDVDTNFQQDVTLVVSGNATVPNNGLVDIVNGVGTILVDNNAAETVNLSLDDSQSTGLDVSSTQDLIFAVESATKFVILNPLDSAQFLSVKVTIEAQNSAGVVDTNFNGTVTLVVTGSATVPDNGLVEIVNGVGFIQLSDSVTETVYLSLSDTGNTGLNVSSTQDVVFLQEPRGVAFKDTFTETGNITLSQHMPDQGLSWTKLIQVNSGTMQVDASDDVIGAGVGGAGTGVLYTADIDNFPGYLNADYIAEVKVVVGRNNEESNIIAIRVQDENNMYALRYNNSSSELFKKVNGTWTSLGTGVGITDDATVKIEAVGNSLKVYVHYDEIISVSDSDLVDPGKAALGMGAVIISGDKLSNQELDNFKVRLDGDSSRIFLDRFNGSGQLEFHVPDEGTSWQKVINNNSNAGIQVFNGTVEKASNSNNDNRGSFYIAIVDPQYPVSDYEVELLVVDGGSGDDTMTLGVRVNNNANDGYFVRFNNDFYQLFKRINGNWSALGAPGPGVKNTIVRLRIVGNTLAFLENEKVLITESVTEIGVPGTAGFGIGAVMVLSDDEKNQKADNFVVRTLS